MKVRRIDGIYHYCDQCYQIERAFAGKSEIAEINDKYVIIFVYDPYKPCNSYLLPIEYAKKVLTIKRLRDRL